MLPFVEKGATVAEDVHLKGEEEAAVALNVEGGSRADEMEESDAGARAGAGGGGWCSSDRLRTDGGDWRVRVEARNLKRVLAESAKDVASDSSGGEPPAKKRARSVSSSPFYDVSSSSSTIADADADAASAKATAIARAKKGSFAMECDVLPTLTALAPDRDYAFAFLSQGAKWPDVWYGRIERIRRKLEPGQRRRGQGKSVRRLSGRSLPVDRSRDDLDDVELLCNWYYPVQTPKVAKNAGVISMYRRQPDVPPDVCCVESVLGPATLVEHGSGDFVSDPSEHLLYIAAAKEMRVDAGDDLRGSSDGGGGEESCHGFEHDDAALQFGDHLDGLFGNFDQFGAANPDATLDELADMAFFGLGRDGTPRSASTCSPQERQREAATSNQDLVTAANDPATAFVAAALAAKGVLARPAIAVDLVHGAGVGAGLAKVVKKAKKKEKTVMGRKAKAVQQKRVYKRSGGRAVQYRISGFTGVTWGKRQRKWRAELYYKGNRYHLGYYDDETAAGHAYDVKCIELGLSRTRNIAAPWFTLAAE